MATRKLDPDATHGEKIIRLFAKLLFTKKSWGLVELSEELRCSKQAVMRMVDEITRCYSVQIEDFMDGNRKYYKMLHRERDPVLDLSLSEVNVLMMCQAFARHMLGEKLFKEATVALEKSHGHLSSEKEVSTNFASISVGTIDYTRHHTHISNLMTAMNEKKVCKVSYQAVESDRPKFFYIKPLKLFSHKNALYLHARMAKHPDLKYKAPDFDPLLAVHRLVGVEVTERPYEFPDDYNFEKEFNRNFGLIKEHSFEVEAEFWGWAAKYVAERIWSPDQKISTIENGAIRISFTASSTAEVLSWMLSMGNSGKLVGPRHLVDELKQKLSDMNHMYPASDTKIV